MVSHDLLQPAQIFFTEDSKVCTPAALITQIIKRGCWVQNGNGSVRCLVGPIFGTPSRLSMQAKEKGQSLTGILASAAEVHRGLQDTPANSGRSNTRRSLLLVAISVIPWYELP